MTTITTLTREFLSQYSHKSLNLLRLTIIKAIIQPEKIMSPFCINCGITRVSYKGHSCHPCRKLLGIKNVPLASEVRRHEEAKVNRQEAKAANAVMIAALPKPSQEELNHVFAGVLKIFDSALEVIKIDNPGKVILISIAATSENVHPVTGVRLGKTIEQEMVYASMHGSKYNFASLVKLVEVGGGTYVRNPTKLERVNIGPPGVLLYDAGNCKHTCEFVELFMQMIILIRTCYSKEKIRLLQFTPGNGGLKAGAPFKEVSLVVPPHQRGLRPSNDVFVGAAAAGASRRRRRCRHLDDRCRR
jgi:hypothetical protein